MAPGYRAECLWPAIAPMDKSRIRPLSFDSRLLDRDASGLRRDPNYARPGLNLSRRATGPSDLEVCSAGSSCGCDSMVGRQSIVWNLRSEDAVWPRLRWVGRRDRFDGVDGVLYDDHFSGRGLERRKHLSIYFFGADTTNQRRSHSDTSWRARSRLVVCRSGFVSVKRILYLTGHSELYSSVIVTHLWNNDFGEESLLSAPSWF